jgi:hypothetical protein
MACKLVEKILKFWSIISKGQPWLIELKVVLPKTNSNKYLSLEFITHIN